MTCKDFPLFYSAQLDGQATDDELVTIQQHLRECIVCRRRAAEMRGLRSDLRALCAPPPSPELSRQIQITLRREAAEAEASAVRLSGLNVQIAGVGGGASWVEFRNDWFNWFDGLRAKIFSQGIGAVVSLCLFFFVVTEVFKQASRTLAQASDPPQGIAKDPLDEAIRYQALLKAALMPSPPPPALHTSDELEHAVASLQEGDVILTAEVRKDGRSTIMYIQPPNDPSVKEKLSTAMSQRGIFQGARPRQNTNPVAVVYLSSMTISGASSI